MNETQVREGVAEVPGARLRYRLAGTAGAPLLVFENGWGASFEMWAWVEQELAPHAQLLLYNRAGIGRSERLLPQTVAGLSEQFAALPAALGLAGPVIAVGQSYGGLMCGLHAAQRPEALRAVVEVDPTPDVTDPDIDGPAGKLPAVIRVLQVWLRLGLPNFLFGQVSKALPKESAHRLLRTSLSNPDSLEAGLAELAMRFDIRARIAAGRRGDLPRLLIGAGALPPLKRVVERLLVRPALAKASFERSKALQHARAAQDPDCRLLMLPHSHGGLVFERDGAQATAGAVLDLLRALPG
jgi:pimeloyl-ACP methyl ester carboxylesterase